MLPVEGVHGMIKESLKILTNKSSSLLIITRNGYDSRLILNGVTRRLNYQHVPYSVDLDDLVLETDDCRLMIISELQLQKITADGHDHVLYNPLIDPETLNTIENRINQEAI